MPLVVKATLAGGNRNYGLPRKATGLLLPMGEVRGRNENAKPGRTLYSCGVLSPVIKGQSLQRSTS